jgi:ubiquinone/menaquinone biosynthesis C-methylase UbiE
MNRLTQRVKQFKKVIDVYQEKLFLDFIYHKYIEQNQRAKEILNLKANGSVKDLLGERNLPSKEEFVQNGWCKTMFLRYGLAMHYSKGKKVLETCSGLGWGAYLLDAVAKSITCVDLDFKCIEFSQRTWKTDRTQYVVGTVLSLPAKDESFDTVIAMESIEHFTLKDMTIYLDESFRILRQGGFLIGSSAFPETQDEAATLCAKNRYHLHISTKTEIEDLLRRKKFKRVNIFKNRMFLWAQK